MSTRKAVVLARGLGRRMREPESSSVLTASQERVAVEGLKVLMPVGGSGGARPCLDFVLSSLADAGVVDIAIVIGPDHTALRQRYEHELTPSRLRLACVTQVEPRGTADAVLAAAEWVGDEPFLAINGDNLYPAAALQALGDLDGPGVAGFSQAGLVSSGQFAADRVAAFAVMRSDANGTLVEVIEKPSPAELAGMSDNPLVSMNCWRFDGRIFAACRDVPLSPRGELELPAAVNLAVARGVRFAVIPVSQPVLDVSRRRDVADVSRWLAGVVPVL